MNKAQDKTTRTTESPNVIKQRRLEGFKVYGKEILNGEITTDLSNIYTITTLQDGNIFVVNDTSNKFMILSPDGSEVSNGVLTTDIGNTSNITTLKDGNVFVISDNSSKFMVLSPNGSEISNGTTELLGETYAIATLQDGNIFIIHKLLGVPQKGFAILSSDGSLISLGIFITNIGDISAISTLQDGNIFAVSEDSTKYIILAPDGSEISNGSLTTDIGNIYTITTLQDGNVFAVDSGSTKYMVLSPDGSEVANGLLTTDIGIVRAITTLEDGKVFIINTASTRFMVTWEETIYPKLTPKTDFIYNYKIDYSGDVSTSTVFNIDTTIKTNEITNTAQNDNYQYISVGKGQFMTMRPSPSAGAQLKLWDKNTGELLHTTDLGLIAGTDAWTDVLKFKSFTFLGQCFLDKGSTDRWVIFNQVNSTTNLRSYPAILNIDTWTVYPFTKLSGFGDTTNSTYYDFTYDGSDRIYSMYYGSGDYSNRRILYWTIENIWNYAVIGLAVEKVPESSLKDSTGSNVSADRIYGMSSGAIGAAERLVYKTKDNKVKTILLTDNTLGGALSLGTNGTVIMCPAGDTISDLNQSQSFVASFADGVSLMKRSNQTQIKLSSSTVEKALNVVYFKHTPNVETEIWLVMVNTGNWNRFTRKFRIDWSAGYGELGVVSNVLIGTAINAGLGSVEEFEISNTCNMYDIGKLYNYGLQKQYNNIIATIEE